ncbi:MAG: class I SAM-dependent methyltransferase [Chromatiales bacterium]|jgi:methylase of polypeptide subunit release factors
MTTLTQQAQLRLQHFLHDGSIAIDATVGNGHDTVFLAERVGPNGKVFGFDVQQTALDNTKGKLQENNLLSRVELLHCSHARMAEKVAQQYHGRIAVIMFNLGYLPGSDKSIITQTQSTLPALQQTLQLLQQGGCLSIMLYPGHAGGDSEAEAVKHWADQLDASWRVSHISTAGPQLLLIDRLNDPVE